VEMQKSFLTVEAVLVIASTFCIFAFLQKKKKKKKKIEAVTEYFKIIKLVKSFNFKEIISDNSA
jgi:hypothetical protein